MAPVNSVELDPLDFKLMSELEINARQTYSAIADHLNIGRAPVALRVQRLLDSNTIRLICWVDPLALGYHLVVSFGISTQPGQMYDVANKLAAIPSVLGVHLCTGRFDIISTVLFRNNDEVSNFLVKELGCVSGILQIDKMLILRELKVSSRLLKNEKESHKLRKSTKELDDLDILLIRELQANPRQRPGFLARKFGIYESTVRRRIQRLEDENIIRIRAIIDPVLLGYDYAALIGLNCDPGKVREVAEAVASYNNVQYVIICAGRYDIDTYCVFKKLSDLEYFISVELGGIPGLIHRETSLIHNIVKMMYQIPV